MPATDLRIDEDARVNALTVTRKQTKSESTLSFSRRTCFFFFFFRGCVTDERVPIADDAKIKIKKREENTRK